MSGQGREASRDLLVLRGSRPVGFPVGTDPSTVSWRGAPEVPGAFAGTAEASRLARPGQARKVKFIEFSLSFPLPLPFLFLNEDAVHPLESSAVALK